MKPGAARYRAGAVFERAVKADLKELGYEVARVAGSRSTYDLVALARDLRNPDRILLIQCRRDGQLPREEWNALHEVAVAVRAAALCAVKSRRQRIEYRRLIAPKDGSRRDQPWGVYLP